MSRTFYGPFDVNARTRSDGTLERIVIEGSDNADGNYEFGYYDRVETISVSGQQWTIEFYLRFGGSSAWRRYVPETCDFVTTGRGLSVHIAGPVVIDGDIAGTSLVLDCVSTDPVLTTPAHPDPPDLSLPG